MGKNSKRKTKPSSSGEDSFLEDTCNQTNKHFEKKAKIEVMAGSHVSVTTSTMTDFSMLDIMKRVDTLEASPTLTDIMARFDTLDARFDTLEASLRSEFQVAVQQAVQKAVDTLTHKHDILEGRVLELEMRKDELQNQNEALRNELQEMRNIVNEQGSAFRDLEQYGRRDNIKVYNLPERWDGTKGETPEETAKAVSDMIARDLNYRVSASDISTAHRLGTKVPGKERSVIVRFVSRIVRNEVVRRRRALKGKGVVIADDLSPFFQKVFFSLREIMGKKNVWSTGNQLFIKTTEGVRKVTGSNIDNILTQVTENPSLIPTTTISGNDNDSGRAPRTDARGGRSPRGRGRGQRTPPGRGPEGPAGSPQGHGARAGRGGLPRGWGRGRIIEESFSQSYMDY